MAGIDALTAAQLSKAAYTKFSDRAQLRKISPAGWKADFTYSNHDASGNNQFITFINDATKQAVITFKGTNTIPQLISDLAGDGYTAWESIKGAAEATLYELRTDLPTYEIMTDGHSLGGGLAQVMALENGLNGYGQNALPISSLSAFFDLAHLGDFAQLRDAYDAAGFRFHELNAAGDIATAYYSTLRGQTYLDHNPTTISNVWNDLITIGRTTHTPALVLGGSVQAHSIDTVIGALTSHRPANGLTSATDANANPNAMAIVDAAQTEKAVVGPSGEVSVVKPDGTQVSVESATADAGGYSYLINESGKSQVATYASDGTVTVSSYSGPNGTEELVSKLTNYTDGHSQFASYYNPGNDTDVSKVVETHSGPNSTGWLVSEELVSSSGRIVTNYSPAEEGVSKTVENYHSDNPADGSSSTGETLIYKASDYKDGTSVSISYNPDASVSKEVKIYAPPSAPPEAPIDDYVGATDPVGPLECKVTNYNDNQSEITAYFPLIDPAFGVSKMVWRYNQPNGQGGLVSSSVDFRNGGSQVRDYDPATNKPVNVDAFDKAGGGGWLLNEVNNLLNGGSHISLSNPLPNAWSADLYYSDPDGAGTLLKEDIRYNNGFWYDYDYSPHDGAKEIIIVHYPPPAEPQWIDIIKNYPNDTSTVQRVRDYGRAYATYLYNKPNGAGDPVRLLHDHGFGVDYDYNPSLDNKLPSGPVYNGSNGYRGGGPTNNGPGTSVDYGPGGPFSNGPDLSGPRVPINESPGDPLGSRGDGLTSTTSSSLTYIASTSITELEAVAADLRSFNASVGAAIDAVRSGPVAALLDRFVGPSVALQMARLLTAGTDLYPIITHAGDKNLFRLAMSAGTTYWFNAEGSSTGQGTISDPDLRLLGNDGVTQLAFGQGNGVGGNSFISYTPATTGTYYMKAGSSGASTGTYFLTERVADDYPSNPATTGTLAAGGSVEGSYDFVADTDWFRTTLTAGTTYRLSAESTPTGPGTQIHPMLWLYGDDGATQVASDLSAPLSGDYEASLSYTPTVSGTYSISVGSYGTNIGTYRLSQAIVTGATPSRERVADDYPSDPATTGTLAAGGSVKGSYDFVADTDWFRTTLTAGTAYRFGAESTPTGPGTQIHPMLWLYGDDGATQVASDLSAPLSGGYEASLSYTPAASGTYYLSVGSYGTNIGTYRLSEAAISGAISSSAADSRMSFIPESSDPAATVSIPGAGSTAFGSVDGAGALLTDLGASSILPDHFFGGAPSVTQPQYFLDGATQQFAASLATIALSQIHDISVMPYSPA